MVVVDRVVVVSEVVAVLVVVVAVVVVETVDEAVEEEVSGRRVDFGRVVVVVMHVTLKSGQQSS